MMIPFAFVLSAVFIPFAPWCSWQQAYPACPTLLTPGVCAGFSLKQQLGWTFPPQCIEYCSPRVSIPGTKGKSCPLLPLLSPCPGSYCCPSLAALLKSGSSSLRAKAHRALLFLPLFTAVSPCPWADLQQVLMHANEALNARGELKNTGVTSLTSL